MAFLVVYSPSDFVQGLPDEAGAQADGSPPFTLTLRPDAVPTVIEITDNDLIFDEIDATQELARDATVDGTLFPSGTTIHTAYDLINTTTGLQVTSFHFGGNGFQQGPVDGIVSTVELVPGTTYTFDQERTSFNQDNPYTGFVACFTEGVEIDTPRGPVPVQDLRVGDLLQTADNGPQPLRVVLDRTLGPAELVQYANLVPIEIAPGALGQNLPRVSLRVSPQHRLLVRSAIADRMFGTSEVLVSAKKLTTLPGIDVVTACQSVSYYHLILDRHEILFANGAPTESLFLGPMAVSGLDSEALDELTNLFPDLLDMSETASSARVIPPGSKQKRLVERHGKNRKPILSAPGSDRANPPDRA